MIEEYRTVTQKYLNQMPDQMYAPLTEAKYETIASAIPSEVEQNYELYKESLEKPMPFYIGKPVIKENILKFNWDASYDFDAEAITYTVELAKDYKFNEIVFRKDNIQNSGSGDYSSGRWSVFCAYPCDKYIWTDAGCFLIIM